MEGDIDDRIIRKVSFRYDSAGHLLEEGEINFEGAISQDFRDTYCYNPEGRCIEKEVRGGISNRRSTMVYNDHGDLVEERSVELPGGIDLRDSVPPEYRRPTSWTVHYSYEYDEFRNWTARTETSLCPKTWSAATSHVTKVPILRIRNILKRTESCLESTNRDLVTVPKKTLMGFHKSDRLVDSMVYRRYVLSFNAG